MFWSFVQNLIGPRSDSIGAEKHKTSKKSSSRAAVVDDQRAIFSEVRICAEKGVYSVMDLSTLGVPKRLEDFVKRQIRLYRAVR